MHYNVSNLICRLADEHTLNNDEFKFLLESDDDNVNALLAEYADAERRRIYGTDVYIRGLIEFTNYCRNNCY